LIRAGAFKCTNLHYQSRIADAKDRILCEIFALQSRVTDVHYANMGCCFTGFKYIRRRNGMNSRLIGRLSLAVLFVATAIPALSQVSPSASEGGLPLVVGVGISDWNLDYGSGRRMEGISAWVDYYPRHVPSLLHGIGLEIEGHDINFNRPSALTKMRQDTGEGGLIYAYDRFPHFRPYAKFLAGIGSIDFPPFPGVPDYSHDTRQVYSPGGGAEFQVYRHLWVRGDYEYQVWGPLFGSPNHLTPSGFTIGASYDFRRLHRH
jgi:opacity protein-like surface antigen